MAPAGGGNIKVVVRCRPFNGRETDRGARCVVEMKDNQTVLTPPNDSALAKSGKDHGQKVFAFDRSYWSFNKDAPNYAGQSNLFDDLGKPLLDNAFQGYNNCIFAYGQTGSGKSYSMMGYGKDAGIIPMICQDMFERIDKTQEADKNTVCTVEVSYLEIYNERVRDLLNPATKGNLKVREHPSTGPYVEDLAKLVVGSFQEIEHLMDEGNKARTVAATNMNETSSRSHAVFTLMLTQKKHDTETNMDMEKVAKISLVDLAGSERATSTGATGARLKEGAEINRSLSTLGRVIAALADLSTGKKKKGPTSQVPYRDSVLTWLLKDSLGGNSMTAMIAAISPADINFDETLSTLRYADSAKRIKNHAVINEDANARMIRELKEELAQLRSKLSGGSSGLPGAPAEEVYAEGTPLDQQIVTITKSDGTTKKVSKAEIAEQLNQSEKLLSDLNQTWEQKLAKTEEIHKEREAALEELGINIEKGFIGLSTPKRMPHLVNLSDDPLLAECLIYNLKPGSTKVGNVESNTDSQVNIRLNGSRILHEHCTFENNATDGTVTLIPKEGAAVMVNGKRITTETLLHSGYRIILGDFHIFRFNHPMEAQAERAEKGQSLLRQSITASQIANLGRMSPTPGARPGQHERSWSKAGSEFGDSRSDSPTPYARTGHDSDWSFARREAAGAILGTDQNLANLNDEKLNALFEEVSRARAERVTDHDGDEDAESTSSYQLREKYMSTGTMDDFSLDTALTIPSTPKQGEVDEHSQKVREELQSQLERQKKEFEDQLKHAEAANVQVDEIKREKAQMEISLQEMKEAMQEQLHIQRREYEAKIERLDPSKRPKANPKLSEDELEVARRVIQHWRGRRNVQMMEAVLQHAVTLKEAQIMSQELDENVVFQFCVVDQGHTLCSSYDMVLNGISDETDDATLDQAIKPCIGVRVVDYKHSVARIWSLQKLHDRVRQMRQMHQYLDQPEYAQHLSLDNPFVEPCMPQYTLVGEADVPLTAVFESRVQDFSLDVLSPHTHDAIGLVKLSLEPSSVRSSSNSINFNVVMHEVLGFAEREGTEVHAQLFIPVVGEEVGVTTTQMISGFDEDAIEFESVHSMSVPLFAPPDTTMRVAIFAKVASIHLDRLSSWDEMRDAASNNSRPTSARIAESHFYTEEKHDMLARIQILELNEEGEYAPVEVAQVSEMDSGTFQLHQGLQRRITINLSHSSGDALPWSDVASLRVGRIQLLDAAGKTPDLGSPTPDVTLKSVTKPVFRSNTNGTRSITINVQWDSSAHGSLHLDRVTGERFRVQMMLKWEISSSKLSERMRFSTSVCCQVLSRSFVRQTSMLSALWQNVRFVHSTTAIFTLQVKPMPVKKPGDLWRMDSSRDYVKGEEDLMNWAPRGTSLIVDFVQAKRRRRRVVEIEGMQQFLKSIGPPIARFDHDTPASADAKPEDAPTVVAQDDDSISELLQDTPDTSQVLDPLDAEEPQEVTDDHAADPEAATRQPETKFSRHEVQILERSLRLWKQATNTRDGLLVDDPILPPTDGTPDSPAAPVLVSSIIHVPKNPDVLKGGYLLVPSNDSTRWIKRFVELRRPYMHIHSVTDGEEVAIVSLRNSRVDSQPGLLDWLSGDDDHPANGATGHAPQRRVNGHSASNHRRTASGRPVSAIWTGSGGTSSRDNLQGATMRNGLAKLSDRLQAGVFAIYGTDNTWLFAARSEKEKLDWIFRIDQSYISSNGSGSRDGSDGQGGAASPMQGGY